jgi:hypothetical protein
MLWHYQHYQQQVLCLVCQRLHCLGERYRHKLGKSNSFYYKKEAKKGGDGKVEMNSWFDYELQCKK